MANTIPQLMVLSANALAIITLGSMFVVVVLLLMALVNFYRASKTKLRSDYSKAFRFSGNGFFILGMVQGFLLMYLDAEHKGNAMAAAIFFILFGAAASFIGEKLKPKPNGRK